MAELVPHSFGRLVTRMFRELEQRDAIFDLPARRFVRGPVDRDLSVRFHDQTASTPLGPAAGPHTQMAQNIVLSFLGGGRIFELKTVQILDQLSIPRPCIDMQTIGYNVEWSQELSLEQSLVEYVKASMLVKMLVHSGKLELSPGFDRVIYDMSVGYDLAGIQSERVQAFLRGMEDASEVVEHLRAQIPDEHEELRDLPFDTRLSNTLTLSTFHGCPPDEIERIIDWLLREHSLSCIVKLNPTLLGADRAREILGEHLGYPDRIPDSAFEKDAQWEQVVDFVGRLGDTAQQLGQGFGVKFTNTLIVENERDFFPESEKVMYLSGPPLHVLAMGLVGRFRETFGDRFPISFSAGIDRENFADAVSLGLVPVTVCSDLLQTGGYARMQKYFDKLDARMKSVGATNVEQWIVRGQGQAKAALDALTHVDAGALEACRRALSGGGDLQFAAGPETWARWVSEAKLLNTKAYVERVMGDPRYGREANSKAPRKVGSTLVLFDCLTCDKCVPVCPNDANFTFVLPQIEIPVVKLTKTAEGWSTDRSEPLRIEKKHQIGNFADFCNECGNCDVFCPEDGGPYVLKPRFFGSHEEWTKYSSHDGFFLSREGEIQRIFARDAGQEYRLSLEGEQATFEGRGFEVQFAQSDPEATIEGQATEEVDLTWYHIMRWVADALITADAVDYASPNLTSGTDLIVR